jgi:hypothetical protein
MRRLGLWIVLAVSVFGITSPVAASSLSGVSAPSRSHKYENVTCTNEPIAIPEQGAVGDLTLPSPTVTAIDESNTNPADDATIAAITTPIEQAIACQNAGDVLRMLASFSDRWIAERFSGYDLVFYGRFLDAAGSATPVPDDGQLSLVSIDDVRSRTDGAVLASVVTNMNGQEQTSLLVLVETADGWKIDGSQPVPAES